MLVDLIKSKDIFLQALYMFIAIKEASIERANNLPKYS